MSNSSITSYEVQRNLLLEAARREAALREIRATRERLTRLCERSRAAGIDANVSAAALEDRLSSALEVQAQAARLRAHEADVQRRLDHALVARELAVVAAIVRAVAEGQPSPSEGASRVQPAMDTKPHPAPQALAEIERLLQVADAPTFLVPELKALAARAQAARTGAEVAVLLVELRARLASAKKLEREKALSARLAQEMLDEAQGLVTAELDACRTKLSAVLDGTQAMTEDLLKGTSEAIAAARRRADREYVGAVVEEKLRALGYQVDSQVQTLFVEGGYVHLRKADGSGAEDHAVELEIQPENAKLAAKVVRITDDPRPLTLLEQRHSAEQQDRWCNDLSELLETFERSGIGCRVTLDPDGTGLPIVPTRDFCAAPRKRRRGDGAGDRVMEKGHRR